MIDFRDSELLQILPQSLASIPEVEALSFVIKKQMEDLFFYIDKIGLFYDLDNVSEDVLDFLAIDLGTQYYDQTLPIENKRNLIKNTMSWYQKAGTIGAVRELVDSLFTSGEVIEWFNSSDDEVNDPYKFMVQADYYSEDDNVTYFSQLLKNVKNARSVLSKVKFLLKETLYNKERFFYAINMRMPVEEPIDTLSMRMKFRARAVNREHLSAHVNTFDGTYNFDGKIRFNAEPYYLKTITTFGLRNKETISATINGEPV